MKKVDQKRQSDEINKIVRQIDHYLASTANPDDPIYQRVRVKVVEKTPSIPANHPFLLEQQFGGYATAFMPRGTVLCHYAGILDFYDNESPNARLRNNYCLGLEDNAEHMSGKRQQLKGGAHSGGHQILVTSYDAGGKWVGNAAGRINDPRGTRAKTNVAIQWIKVHSKDQPDLVVDMPFFITTEEVQPNEPFSFDYGLYFFTDSTESSCNPVSLDAPESCLMPRAFICGECGKGLFRKGAGGTKPSVLDGTFQCCTSLGCDSEVWIRIKSPTEKKRKR
ncbi:hypothetical protein GCM10023116_17410 [Kistimonas scapharcae]|uniref:Uncharacterized protein n=2 Tax=Kistimonas scapharcae TaxID=1036133 RepID=A0ABP8V0R1_9GAMM